MADAAPVWSEWFAEVVPGVLLGMQQYNADAGLDSIPGRGLFLIVHGYGEQAPRFGPPSKNQNRLFNLHVRPDHFEDGKPVGVEAGQAEPGLWWGGMAQGEGATDAERKPKDSMTFFYESVQRGVTHFYTTIKKEKRYPNAYKILVDKNKTYSEYFQKLQDEHYATEKGYAKKLNGLYYQVLKQLRDWLRYRIAQLDARIASIEQVQDRLDRLSTPVLPGISQGMLWSPADQANRDWLQRQHLASKKADLARLRAFQSELPPIAASPKTAAQAN
jgi:hypothetical protein